MRMFTMSFLDRNDEKYDIIKNNVLSHLHKKS